jgi:phosphoglycerol transferase MdoB-like AlkP superfamily enzyme
VAERTGNNRTAESAGARVYGAAAAMLAYIPAAIYLLYAKYSILNLQDLWTVAARQAGYSAEKYFSVWQRISFFREDLLVGFVIIPGLLFLATVLLSSRLRGLVVALASSLISLFLFAQIKTYANIGRFLTVSLLTDAIQWARADSQIIPSYLTPRSTFLLLFTIAAIIAASRLVRRWRVPAWCLRWTSVAAVLLTVLAFASRLPSSTMHTSFLVQSIESFAARDAAANTYASLTPAELIAAYRQMASAPAPEHNPAYWAREKGADVLFFIMETAPARYLETGGGGPLPPGLTRLSRNAFVSSLHHTTYPYTNRATFSIFSSWYPGAGMRTFIQQYPDLSVPGPIAALDGAGYDTGIYVPAPPSLEAGMYPALGFRREAIPDKAAHAQLVGQGDSQERLARDKEAFALLKHDIEDHLAHNRRYAFAFLPQVGHGPWDSALPGSPPDMPGRGRALMALEDAWIQDLIDLLAHFGRLEHTIIVVTGDHGIRTRAEDPSLSTGMVDEYSFRVPLLVYAPSTLQSRWVVPWLTSHIDIGPTVLDLLGIETGRSFEQGSPVWDSRLRQRKTFFFARHYLGSDGVYANGSFWMYNDFLETSYRASKLRFSAADMLPGNSPDQKWAVKSIDNMENLAQAWAAKLGRNQAARRR